MAEKKCVSVSRLKGAQYPSPESKFRPDRIYPEYIFTETTDGKNEVYGLVRQCLFQLGLDQEHYGTEKWNPFGKLIQENETVLIKPNLVQDFNCNPRGGVYCLYTQPAVVAPVIDYALKALNGTGRVIVGDAPMQECNFDKLVKESGYEELIAYYQNKGINIEMVDFRKEITVVRHRVSDRTPNDAPSVIVNLEEESEFAGISRTDAKKLRIVMYPHDTLTRHHQGNTHEYCVSKYVLDADVVINMPKPKTHKKAGVTIALKNLVGMNAKKEYLPHHTFGSKEEGGDEYKNKNLLQHFRARLYDRKYKYEEEKKGGRAQMVWFAIAFCTLFLRLFRIKYENGSWYGNETISKTIVDLNKILLYADKKGKMRSTRQRKYFIVADMIVSGEKNGPVAPSPKPLGVVAAGFDPVCFDRVVTTLMGFDVNKIPTLCQAVSSTSQYKIGEAGGEVIVSNDKNIDGKVIFDLGKADGWQFTAPGGWQGHIEMDQ